MQNVNGELNTKKYIIETTGSGVAVLDYDRDGWPDIYLVMATALDRTRNENAASLRPPLPQQSRWHVHRCDPKRRAHRERLGTRRMCGRLRQRRIR